VDGSYGILGPAQLENLRTYLRHQLRRDREFTDQLREILAKTTGQAGKVTLTSTLAIGDRVIDDLVFGLLPRLAPLVQSYSDQASQLAIAGEFDAWYKDYLSRADTFKDALRPLIPPQTPTHRPSARLVNRSPWRFKERYQFSGEFVKDAVEVCGYRRVATFYADCCKGLTPQINNILTNGWLPESLLRRRARLTVPVVKEQLGAWRAISSDWDKWTRVAYGLLSLVNGKSISWEETGNVKLYDRVAHLAAHPKLSQLACKGADSVTVRNAFAHGNSEYNPATGYAEFPDLKRKVVLPARDIRLWAIDMALSNYAICSGSWLGLSSGS
jgi:hypothetical protein